jgi:hypothetical protein
VEGFCEHGNKPSGCIKCWEVLEQLRDLRLLMKLTRQDVHLHSFQNVSLSLKSNKIYPTGCLVNFISAELKIFLFSCPKM